MASVCLSSAVGPAALTRTSFGCGRVNRQPAPSTNGSRSRPGLVRAAWTKVGTTADLESQGGRVVVEVGGQKILVQSLDGEVYAVSNKCSHLGLPLQGKIMSAKVENGCVVCVAHNTAFDLKTGEVKGEWCPGFPSLPLVGKMTEKKPLPTFEVRVEDGAIEVNA